MSATELDKCKPVKVNKFLTKKAEKFVGKNKPFSSLTQFANHSFRKELEGRGVKV